LILVTTSFIITISFLLVIAVVVVVVVAIIVVIVVVVVRLGMIILIIEGVILVWIRHISIWKDLRGIVWIANIVIST